MNLLVLTVAEWIAIVNIFSTCFVGVLIAISVQNNLTKSRYLRDYFIQEIKDIRDQYKKFLNEIYCGNKSAVDIKDWLKIMSLKINNLNEFLHDNYNIKGSIVKEKHSEIQKFITGSDDFNENFKNPKIVFAESTKLEILRLNASLLKALMQRVVDINKARKSNWIRRLFHKS